MAKRFTCTEKWDKEWFMRLPCKLKCLVGFVRDKCDIAGVWSPNWTIAQAYIGEPVTEKELIEIDGGKQFKKIGGGKIFCLGFIEFQYGTLSEKSPVHRKIISILNSHKIPYQYPINRVQEEEEDKEEEKEKVKEKEADKEKGDPKIKIEIVLPFQTDSFRQAWGAWKDYKKAQYRFEYKGENTEQIALKALAEKSGNNEKEAIQIIQNSIANGYKGLFKSDDNGRSKTVIPINRGSNSRLSQEYLDDLERRLRG